MSTPEKAVKITVELTDEEAWEFAQFLKRSRFDQYRENAENNEQAYTMIAAGARIRQALAEKGYAPR